MEDNEKSPVEETTVVETPNETAPEEDTVREDAKTQTEAGSREDDLRVPLKEERERRQRLEQSLNDPNFIYERARVLGLTDGDTPPAQAPAQSSDVSAEVRRRYRVEKAMDKYPELAGDDKLQMMVSALIHGGIDPVDAADEVFSRMKRGEEVAKAEAAKQAKAEISEKEKAQMASNTVRTDSDSERIAEIRKNMKSPDRITQEQATVEWLKSLNEKSGI